jgi:hypothetical protein
MNRAAYERYLAAFNARDYDGVGDYYAQPMKLDFFGVSLRSREDLKRFYGSALLREGERDSRQLRRMRAGSAGLEPDLPPIPAKFRRYIFFDITAPRRYIRSDIVEGCRMIDDLESIEVPRQPDTG